MAKLSYSIALNLLTNGVKNGAREVEATFKRLGSTIKNALGTVGLGLGFAEFGRQMIDAGKNFESGMSRVKAVTNASKAELKQMTDEAKKLGATTKYSASEAAGALENLTRNGLKPAEATASLSKVLELAQANSIGLAEAADLCTNTMNGFSLAVTDLDKVNDSLSATAANSATNVMDLGEAMKNAAPLANNCKIGIQETSAALGTLANVGIKGADAGTALRQFFMGLSTTTPEATKALSHYGLTINQATIAADGLQGTLEKLSKSGIGADNGALAAVFGRRAFAGAASLINNYSQFVSLNTTLGNASGTTARMFEQSAGKMDAAISSLKSSWEAFCIEMFDSGEGMFVGPINGLTAFVRWATNNLTQFVATVAIIFGSSKLAKIWATFSTAARGAFERTVSEASAANSKIKALQKQRVTIEQQMARLETKIAESTGQSKILYEQQYQLKKRELIKQGAAFEKAMAERNTAIDQGERLKQLSGWKLYFAQLKAGFSALKGAFAAIWSTVGPMVIISIITDIAFKIKSVYDEAQRVKQMQHEYNAELQKATHTKEIMELQRLKTEYNKTKEGSKDRLKLEGQISGVIGQHVKGAKQVNSVLNERISLLRQAAEMEFYTNKSLSAANEMTDIEAKYGGHSPQEVAHNRQLRNQYGGKWLGGHAIWNRGELMNDIARYNELKRQRDRSDAAANKIQSSLPQLSATETNFTPYTGAGTHTGKTDVEKAAEELADMQRSYKNSLKDLDFQLKQGWITESDYQKSLRELQRSTYTQSQSAKYASTRNSDFAMKLESLVKNGLSDDQLNFLQYSDNFKKSMNSLNNKFENGAISWDAYQDAMNSLIVETLENVASSANLTDAQKQYITNLKNMRQQFVDVPSPSATNQMGEFKAHSTMSNTEVMQEQFELAKKRYEDMQQAAQQYGDIMNGALNEALQKAQDLGNKLKILKAKDALKEFRNNARESFVSAVSNVETLKNSWQSLTDTLSDTETDGITKAFAIFDTLAESVNNVLAMCEAIKKFTVMINAMSEARKAAAAAAVSANATEAASTAASATTEVAANTAVAGAEAGKGAAKLPFPANIVAIGAAIAAVLALFSQLPKFANGGIMGGVVSGGSSFGDMNLARVNAGEMILNGTQQKTLFNAINSGDVGGGGGSQIVGGWVRGETMYLSIKNYMSKNGKKW